MLDNVAIEVGPSRFARAFVVLLAAALAITPAAAPSRSASSTATPARLTHRTCWMSPGDVRPEPSIRTRAAGLNPRYLQRDLGRDVMHAR